MIKRSLEIELEVITGLHIGIGDDKIQIGGVDSAVVKDPITKVPYIPGSSLKGKLRCLLETEALDDYDRGPNNTKINKYFGPTSEYLKKRKKSVDTKQSIEGNDQKSSSEAQDDIKSTEEFEISLSRFIFRDLKMNAEQERAFIDQTRPLEVKTEISINRKTGMVNDSGPRTIERVPASTKFHGSILFRCKDEGEYEEMQKMLDKAFELLKNDALGGSGSRGYGAVAVNYVSQDSPVKTEKGA